ncbi:type IV toxin-antitoxin system AbiEi family antitoxin [Pseudonocardia sp. H11422]|uniref:type IV toxin-antitoxin system AbiEi family antitoxin n=1 Tax=Pseudonocardia sp. H11422 TaxID=2835866 RepID=UPI001BDD144C|nr:type IV toxin-antitoxin system AbiEi family antitoxin [Pseudonocardia sp. H11422]
MGAHAAARVPSALLSRGRVLRPIDAQEVYANPRADFARLERRGALHRLAPGLFAAVPDDAVGADWLPPLEAAALAIAGTGGHTGKAALTGISAARVHAAIPRALNVAVVAVARHRRTLQLTDRKAEVLFVRRDVARLDVQRYRTELGQGWVTTVEQTVLDLIARPELGNTPDAAREAIAALIPRADTDLLRELAVAQRRRGAVEQALVHHRERA